MKSSRMCHSSRTPIQRTVHVPEEVVDALDALRESRQAFRHGERSPATSGPGHLGRMPDARFETLEGLYKME